MSNEITLRDNQSMNEQQESTAAVSLEKSKTLSRMESMLVIAKKFPRNEVTAHTRIMQNCKYPKFAEEAMYAYPRGGQVVTGPSIRMAELMQRCWGNMITDINELSREDGRSEVIVSAWDLENNIQDSRTFTVSHVLDTKRGPKRLTDGRDIYELISNQAQRRKRACMLALIPSYIIDDAIAQCEATLKQGGDGPLIERIRRMVIAFSEIGVQQQHIEKRLGHNIEVTIEAEMVTLQKIYRSIKDGMAKREDFFEISLSEKGFANDLNDVLNVQSEKK